MGYGRHVNKNKAKSREIHEHLSFTNFRNSVYAQKDWCTHSVNKPFPKHCRGYWGIIGGDTQFIFCRLSMPMEADNMSWNLLIFLLCLQTKRTVWQLLLKSLCKSQGCWFSLTHCFKITWPCPFWKGMELLWGTGKMVKWHINGLKKKSCGKNKQLN